MSKTVEVLVVANRTAASPSLLETVAERAQRGPVRFHLLVPASPRGLHRVVDPEDAGRDEAERNLAHALPLLCEAAGGEVEGRIGDPNPLAAIQDALNLGRYDEIILSTFSARVSRWLKLDLPSKVGALGVPVTHVEAPASTDSRGDGSRQRAPA